MSERKLQPYQVVRLRQMRREGFTRAYLCRVFGISMSVLYLILSHSTYKNVK